MTVMLTMYTTPWTCNIVCKRIDPASRQDLFTKYGVPIAATRNGIEDVIYVEERFLASHREARANG